MVSPLVFLACTTGQVRSRTLSSAPSAEAGLGLAYTFTTRANSAVLYRLGAGLLSLVLQLRNRASFLAIMTLGPEAVGGRGREGGGGGRRERGRRRASLPHTTLRLAHLYSPPPGSALLCSLARYWACSPTLRPLGPDLPQQGGVAAFFPPLPASFFLILFF